MSKKIKKELVRAVAIEQGKSIKTVEPIVNAFLSKIRETLLDGQGVLLKGLGEFSLKDTEAKIVSNYFAGEPTLHQVEATKIVKFTVSKGLQDKVKEKFRTSPGVKRNLQLEKMLS